MNKEQQIKLFSNLAAGAAALCAFIALLLLLNYLQIKRAAPLESAAMEALLERLEEEPNNEELKAEIRNLDLLARKAFFNNQWQVNTGALLLLISAIVFGISLNALNKLKTKIEMPEQEEPDRQFAGKLSQRGIMIIGAAMALLALGAAYFTKDHLGNFYAGQEEKQDAKTEQIEIIDLASANAESPAPAAVAISEADSSGSSADTAAATSGPQAGLAQDTPAPASYPGAAAVLQQHGSFRGPFGNGVSFHRNIPAEWDGATGQNILWKVPLPGKGNNSPIIWGDKLFLAAADRNSRLIYCYSRNSGALLWQQAISGVPESPGSPPKTTDDTGFSAPTLAADGVRVYAIFATGDAAALDFSGKLAWARNLGLPDNHYGHASSLQTWQGKLFVQYDTNKGAKVMALDCGSGKTLWETNRKVKISWASPILASIGGAYQLVLSADPLVAAYDPDTGRELWSVNCMMGEVGPSPAFGSGLVFAANEYARLAAIRPGGGAAIVWETDEYLPEVASPVAAEGLLYVATSYGVVACYDAMNGKKYWEHECGAGFYASPAIAEGKLYALDREGVMHIFSHDKEKQLLSEPQLGERAVASPAFANGKIYLRGEKHLYCIGK